jgi:hypothetical protein
VRIQALKEIGSARLLHGICGEVLRLHPIARGWYIVQLDANGITTHLDWPVPGDCLISDLDPLDLSPGASTGSLGHFP